MTRLEKPDYFNSKNTTPRDARCECSTTHITTYYPDGWSSVTGRAAPAAPRARARAPRRCQAHVPDAVAATKAGSGASSPPAQRRASPVPARRARASSRGRRPRARPVWKSSYGQRSAEDLGRSSSSPLSPSSSRRSEGNGASTAWGRPRSLVRELRFVSAHRARRLAPASTAPRSQTIARRPL